MAMAMQFLLSYNTYFQDFDVLDFIAQYLKGFWKN